jgi:solute:Na+ symporter, SSS family
MKPLSKTIVSLLLVQLCAVQIACAASPPAITADDRAKALATLREALAEQPAFAKVHAAEALQALGYYTDVSPVFDEQLKVHGNEPHYRTGILRVLARTESRRDAREVNIARLRDIYFSDSSPDRIHVLEALAKLGYSAAREERSRFRELLPNEPDAEACLQWVFANSSAPDDIRALSALLDRDDAKVRGLAAYALRHLHQNLPNDVVQKLMGKAAAEPQSEARINLLAAAYVAAPDATRAEQVKKMLLPYAQTGAAKEKYQLLLAVAERGTRDDADLARQLMNDADPDVRIGAAYALLRIDRRKPNSFSWLDWLVLAAYAGGMLWIGWYFSRREADSDEYILAGRTMKALPVGLSYFATLFSTISYLSTPGEVIAHGPLVIGTVLSYPVVFIVVGYFLIPYIMRLRVTSAYEILEKRFGISVRMLGSSIFMALRLAWMGMILYGMAGVVLVPLLGFDVSATPWLAGILGLITVCYTSMGGLKAVIWTDVAQTVVLMLGAILCIVMVSIYLGGLTAWWPNHWAAHWEAPRLWFDPRARVTLAAAATSQFCWYICTAGSDQMAVQRYLATKDASTARRMFAISLCCDAFVALLLISIGLSLYAFFSQRPDMLPDGVTLVSGADQMFPQFIVAGLPRGITGLVIAGLAAAAMSSLSSGVSSTSSVVTIDWIDRFRQVKLSETEKVRVARACSWVIGIVIVILSLIALGVGGNLYEKAFKFINLFTAPLFVLFFMAMFVPRASTLSAWAAGLAGWAMAVVIAYTHITGLSFFWIMPLSLITGIIVGCLATILPFGRKQPMLEMKEVAT